MDSITPTTLLISGITVLGGCIAALVLYIKSIHKRHEEKIASMYEKNLDMASKFIEAVNKAQAVTETMEGTIERNTVTINDLHKYIMSQKK